MKPSLALAGLLVAAVSAQGADPAAAMPGPPVARVALVGVDGLGARNIPWDAMPNLSRLRDEGLYAVGRCGYPTLSAPNWTHGDASMPSFEIPFLVSGPVAKTFALREPILAVDVAPTILALLGLDVPEIMRGRPAVAPPR